ncbi:MAG: hypothetical protein LAN63_13880 [Acidobacteriia bacterium]|nr:hypothetical protein [Terriglobia bacterium]
MARAFPKVDLGCGPHVEYVGVYSPDGKFNAVSSFNRLSNGEARDSTIRGVRALRPSEVPPFITLRPRERVVENYEPPAHARKTVKGQSLFAALLDGIVTFAYGRQAALQTPNHVTTDSKGRIIVSDAAAVSVHVLGANTAFRIAGGPHRRLQAPNGVAVDAQDNIYIADSERGLVLVYDVDGRFLRYIGKLENESLFHLPAGIAIDRSSGRLYLLDSRRNLLFVLDLQGNILNRIGKYRGNASPIEFDAPTEIVLAGHELVVLDSEGSRIQILDLQGNPLRQFRIRAFRGEKNAPEMGLGVDIDGDIYVSNLDNSTVRVYDREGHLLSSFGRQGINLGEFISPTGLWVDASDRVYVADTGNRRVQVFQLSSSLQ